MRIQICCSILCIAIFTTGCDPGIVTNQSWRIQITSAADQEPVANLRITIVDNDTVRNLILQGESVEDIASINFFADSNGVAVINEEKFTLCVADPPPGPKSCSELATVDFNTGTTKNYYVGENDSAEFINLKLEVGNIGIGDLYSIEVLEIGPTELLIDYTAGG
jgi:hypothetical protein